MTFLDVGCGYGGQLIVALENAIGKKAQRTLLPMQPGDMPRTYADIDSIRADHGFEPTTSIEDGTQKFVDWYRAWAKVD